MLINELSTDDITDVIININQRGVISAYFPYDSKEDQPKREFVEADSFMHNVKTFQSLRGAMRIPTT